MAIEGDAEAAGGTSHRDEQADEASEESFPASDAPAGWSGPDEQPERPDENGPGEAESD